ncbi:hypothetical protein SAMN05216266_105188 [Amycolatopsis marina]|uniref:Uncharacterized protein n=1 Tax=Amycolatopsis marina TaxID=490629 RepID=A0A1I0YMW2_9PSEU|nr:hypothetical protein [Amycolatopsis marina]SFB14237.1 hypothetical protein SAMN05216266_105188 [Amycolatopsis marina]
MAIDISPALAHAFALLRNDLYTYLDVTEALATDNAVWRPEDVRSARRVIGDLVEVIRSVVAQHCEDAAGGCRFCHSMYWPCSTIEAVYRVLRDPDREFVRLVQSEPGSW